MLDGDGNDEEDTEDADEDDRRWPHPDVEAEGEADGRAVKGWMLQSRPVAIEDEFPHWLFSDDHADRDQQREDSDGHHQHLG